ncbi:DUF6279 family lipoprotein [Enterovibrio sp. ZSDZ42]|uniref:DUF6279 family lipoprotein n=1 Tax=Enterovibrio gelatinilyticus TaxID=2899819 RepID=A0ABT5R3D7_9GAMM|nr:DUF6279 family lipoprotein [Enterovibrio sp. ZSDZ42]MDD1794776.1 DUF6279 family lipoprotein [Enterovibrio sp. ZSDZ42]
MKHSDYSMKNMMIAAFMAFSLTACTNQFAYNTLPFWIDYYLSDYVDMTSSQQQQLDKDLEVFHSWHRQVELPKIQALLKQVEQDTASPLSYSKIGEYHQQVNETILASLVGLTPPLANLIRSLSDEQVEHWLQTLKDNIDEGVEKANEGTTDDQVMRRQTRLVERMEVWVDAVNDKQQLQLTEMASYQIEMRPVFYDIRDRLLEELTAILLHRNEPDIEQRINDYFSRLVHFQSDEYQSDMAIYLARRYELLQRLDRHLSDKQRQVLRDKLASYVDDINDVLQ